MIALLSKSLRGRHARRRLAVTGVAACTLLVIVIASAFRSVQTALSSYAGQPGVDLWIAPNGADNLIRGSTITFIPLTALEPIRAIPGVAAADPVLEAFLPVQLPGARDPLRRLTLLTIGYRQPDGLGGPPGYASGRPPRSPDEIALDRAAAFRLGVGIGDAVEIGGFKVKIAGLTTGTNILATQFVFTSFDAAAAAGGLTGQAAFILIKLSPGANRESVVGAVEEKFPGLRAYTRAYFVAANAREVTAGFVPLMALIAGLGMGAAAVLIGLLILSVVDERRADLAVVIAMGMGTGAAGGGVLAQAAAISLKGTLIGAALSVALKLALDAFLPTIPLRLFPADILLIALLFILAGLGSAVVPVLRLKAVDPLEAFRA
jgi:putative ABC transport system permease protein